MGATGGQPPFDQRRIPEPRLIGYVDDDRASRRALAVVVLIALITTLVVILYLQAGQSAAERPSVADGPAWGSATHESTRVQPPTWWPSGPPPSLSADAG